MIDAYRTLKKRGEQMAREGRIRRAELLKLVPNNFTARDLINASGLSIATIGAQIQKMVIHKEVTQNSTYSKPRIYTKVMQ